MRYTVAQLIEKLQEFPSHYAVFVNPVYEDLTDNVDVTVGEGDTSDGVGCIEINGLTP